MKKIVILLLILCSTTVHAEEWTKGQKIYGTTFTLLSIVDWGQTRDLVKRKKRAYKYNSDGTYTYEDSRYERANFLLGKDPSMGDVNTYFPIAIGAVLIGSHFVSSDLRTKILKWGTNIEIGIVHGNYQIGLNIDL